MSKSRAALRGFLLHKEVAMFVEGGGYEREERPDYTLLILAWVAWVLSVVAGWWVGYIP